MNDATFTELVNLYLDQEITSGEIKLLREALAASPTRKAEFEARYRLHRAMRMAVASEAEEAALFRDLAIKKTTQASRLTIWVLGSGVAACATMGFVLLRPVILESNVIASASELVDVSGIDSARFAANQAAGAPARGSLTSQLRLMGLTPEMAPSERQLSSVDVEAQQQREARRRSEIERMNQYKDYSAMPDPQLFDLIEQTTRETQNQTWPAGFQSSLASF
jgi:hypothetical protein